MTYMSIVHIISQLVNSSELVVYQPTVVRPTNPQGGRSLWLTPQTFDWCFPDAEHSDPRITDDSLAHLGDQMNAFVFGEFMDYRDGIDMKRLCPPELDIWEIRSHLKKPQLRVFGWFALPKWFVATNFAVRDDLEPDHGPKWAAAISTADHIRTQLVGSVDHYNDDPSVYIRNPT